MAPKREAAAPEYTEDFDGAIGIDLGTTYSCIAVWRNDRVEIISNQQGKSTTPSFVGFTNDEKLVGEAAMNQISTNPTNTIYDAKRLIGRKWSDPKVQNDAKIWPFEVEGDERDEPRVRVEFDGATETFSPQQISGFLLESFKDAAERHLGKRVKRAVVTVPAYFNDSQRAATKFAGELAGLEILRVINEPTAAALAYGLDGKDKNDQKGEEFLNVLVFDLGGGTFDVSVIQLVPEMKTYEVKATAGDTHLGGQDFDQNMVEYCIAEIKKKCKDKDMEFTKKTLRKIRSKCEAEKKALSSAKTTQINLELPGDIDLNVPISRAKFEQLNQEPFERCMKFVTKALEDAKMGKEEISEVVMVGGSSRIPKINQMVTEYFGKAPKHSINPDEAVAHGAAIQAHILSSKGEGANSQNDRTEGIILIDVMPLSIGVGIDQGMMDILIPRNSPIPRKKEKVYSTEDDEQTEVEVEVYEGERKRVEHNNKLGEFQMSGITPGTPQIKVIFDVDANGMLTVTAEEVGGESKQTLDICNTDRANNEKIEDMLADAARFRKADQEFAKKVRVKTNLESWSMELNNIVTGEKYGKLFSDEIKGKVAEIIDWVEEQLQEAGIEDLEEQMDEVDDLYQQVYDLVEDEKDRAAKEKKSTDGKGQKRKRSEDSDDDEDFESGDEDSESEDFSEDEDEEGEKKKKKKQPKTEAVKPKAKKAPAKKPAAKKEGGEKKAAGKAPVKKKAKKEEEKKEAKKEEEPAKDDEEAAKKEDEEEEKGKEDGEEGSEPMDEGKSEAEGEGSPKEDAPEDKAEEKKGKATGKAKKSPKPRAKKAKDATEKPKAKPKPKAKKAKDADKAEGDDEKPKAKAKAAPKKAAAKKATPKAAGEKAAPKAGSVTSPGKKKLPGKKSGSGNLGIPVK